MVWSSLKRMFGGPEGDDQLPQETEPVEAPFAWPEPTMAGSIARFEPLTAKLNACDFAGLKDDLAALRSESVDTYSAAVQHLAWCGQRPTAIFDRWSRSDASSHVRLLLDGANLVAEGWRARSFAQARQLSDGQVSDFRQLLGQAKPLLEESCRLDGSQGEPWYWLSLMARGLGESELMGNAFFNCLDRADGHYCAHVNMLHGLCQKWYGNHDQMFRFAELGIKTAPTGSPLFALVAHAHVERWLHMASFSESEAEQAAGYMYQPEVVDALETAFANSFEAGIDATSPATRHAAGAFATAFFLAERPSTVRLCLEHLREGCYLFPIAYLTPNFSGIRNPLNGLAAWCDA